MRLFGWYFPPELNTKTWTTLPAFHRLLIQSHPTHGFERYRILSIDDTAKIRAGQNSS
jgi:hypothetical protein